MLRLWSYDFEAFHGAQHGDRRSDHAIPVQQRRTDQSQRDYGLAPERVRIAPLLLKNERQQRENSALAVVVRPHDEDDVLDADDDYQRPDDQRENAIDVVGRGSDAVLQLEALAQRVQRTGTDVAVDDAERENCEFCETAAARTRFYISTDLRDLLRFYGPTAQLVALTSEFPQAGRPLQGRYRP